MTVTAAASSGPSALWYLSRGTGVVALLLLTASVVLGVVNLQRWRGERWPRFVIDGLHRNVSLLVLAVLAIHILSTIVDGFAPIGLRDALVPFVSRYRPVWLGLGALAFDLLLALTLTSLLRHRLGHRAWRRVHWLAYACWPVALVHGLGTGTDTGSAWMLVISIGCLGAVWLATWQRVSSRRQARRAVPALAALVLAPLLLAVWIARGPLGPAWARRSGTPASLLASYARAGRASARAPRPQAQPALTLPFRSRVTGTLAQGQTADGLTAVNLAMRFSDRASGVVDVRIEGDPAPGGGVSMTQSQVTMGPGGDPGAYTGRVLSLDGQRIQASVADGHGRSAVVDLALAIDTRTASVGGTITARPGSGAP